MEIELGSPVGKTGRGQPATSGTRRLARRSILAVGLLGAGLVLALGILSGTAAAETSSTRVEEEVEEESAPVEEESAPVEEESAPVEEESAPVEEESAPVEEESASVEEESVLMAEVTPASHEINQCNPPEYPGDTAGHEVTCDVTIENTITPEGDESSVVTTRACLADAGVLPPFGCTTVVSEYGHLTTDLNQCNGIAYGGGSNVTCSVTVINNVPVGTDTTPVTVNQCNGSGNPSGPSGLACDPDDASTSGAMVNQCNNSAYGGGSTVICTVEGEQTAVPLTIDQCNDSAYGGGDTVNCAVTVTNRFIEPDDGNGDDGNGDGGPINGLGNEGPLAVTPVSLTTPISAAPAAVSPRRAASAASEASSLPVTGSGIGSMMALGLMALMLGSLLMLIARSASKLGTKS